MKSRMSGSGRKIMSTQAADRPATARDVILEVIRNMREGLEPLHYTTLPPAIYHVYLHPEDFERLRGYMAGTRRDNVGRNCSGSVRRARAGAI
jgi:hypothetical protein